MKQIFILLIVFTCSLAVTAQGNGNGKAKGKYKNKTKTHSTIQGNTNDGYAYEGNNAKHVPKKVLASLQRDYPGARNVSWGKYRGDYTATFSNGLWRSTAIYHANGERRDTRTRVQRKDMPGNIWDVIFKRDNVEPKDYVMIERPTLAKKIYRVLTGNNTAYYYDEQGNKVSYTYW